MILVMVRALSMPTLLRNLCVMYMLKVKTRTLIARKRNVNATQMFYLFAVVCRNAIGGKRDIGPRDRGTRDRVSRFMPPSFLTVTEWIALARTITS